MEKAYCEAFRNILRRIMADSNRERYRAICQHTCNKDEERIWQLCEHFWPKAYSDRSLNIEEYHPNNELDEFTAKRYIIELNDLLDKLGWEK